MIIISLSLGLPSQTCLFASTPNQSEIGYQLTSVGSCDEMSVSQKSIMSGGTLIDLGNIIIKDSCTFKYYIQRALPIVSSVRCQENVTRTGATWDTDTTRTKCVKVSIVFFYSFSSTFKPLCLMPYGY